MSDQHVSVSPERSAKQAAIIQALLSDNSVLELSLLLLSPAQQRLLRRLALVRRFNNALLRDLLYAEARTNEQEIPFERTTAFPGISPEEGRPGWYRVSTDDRNAFESAWLEDVAKTTTVDDTVNSTAFRSINARLADWFALQGAEDELEVFYHRLVSDDDVTRQFRERFVALFDSFDLARCQSLLDLLEQRSRFLSTELSLLRSDGNAMLRTRSALADDYFRTGRYLERESLMQAFRQVQNDPQRFILRMHGGGGRGKTMFLRWLAARICLPEKIPVARVDFDFLDESEIGLAPRFFLGKLAERLNPQIARAPFTELLDDVNQQRRAAVNGKQLAPVENQERTVLTRMARVLAENCHGTVVFMLDTLEDASLKHGVDLLAVVRTVYELREAALAHAAERGLVPPNLMLLLSGRYPLDTHFPDVQQAFGQMSVACEVKAFDGEESLQYMTLMRKLPESDIVREAVKRARGIPFHLSLYADVLQANPQLAIADLGRSNEIDLLYLIERVLKRIPDFPLRWTLRYGVVARRLTRQFLEDVLGPHLLQAMRGNEEDRRSDDPESDDVRNPGWKGLFIDRKNEVRESLDYDDLWKRLCDYASESSWITSDSQGTRSLSIQPVVRDPMRRVLRDRKVVFDIHRDAVRILKSRVDAGDEPLTEHLASLTYHEFQRDVPTATDSWMRRLKERVAHPAELRALASVVLSEDLRESESSAAETSAVALVSSVVEARAHFALAEAAFAESHDAIAERRQGLLAEARMHLLLQDALNIPIIELRVSPLADALLRWRVANGAVAIAEAMQRLVSVAESKLSDEDCILVLRALSEAEATTDPLRATEHAEKLAQLAKRHKDADSFGAANTVLISVAIARGAHAAALEYAHEAANALHTTSKRWDVEEDSVRELQTVNQWKVKIRALMGLSDRALEGVDRAWPVSRTGGQALITAERLVTMAGLLVKTDKPIDALIALSETGEILKQGRTRTESDLEASRRRMYLQRSQSVEAEASRQLMVFGAAINLIQAAQNSAEELGDIEALIRARLAQARIYLFDIGDLSQAKETLANAADTARSFDMVDLRVESAVLQAFLLHRIGDSALGLRALTDAEAMAPQATAGTQAQTAVRALAIAGLEQREHFLALLRDALARVDNPSSRTAMLSGLKYAAPLTNVADSLVNELVRMTEPEDPIAYEARKRSPYDRARMQLRRVELLRVLGKRELAETLLRKQVSTITKLNLPFLNRRLVLAAGRLSIDASELITSKWLDEFISNTGSYPLLRSVTLREQGEQELRLGSSAKALEFAQRSEQALLVGNSGTTRHEVELHALFEALAVESGNIAEIESRRARAARVRESLGDSAPSSSPLLQARSDAWLGQLSNAEALGVAITDSAVGQLISWEPSDNTATTTARSLSDRLRDMLGAAEGLRKSSETLFPVVQEIEKNWQSFGARMGAALLPTALRTAISQRFAEADRASDSSTPDSAEKLSVAIECDNPAHYALPWELTILDSDGQSPVALASGLQSIWRGPARLTPQRRIVWAQNVLSRLLGQRIAADGIAGAQTQSLLQDFQQQHSVPKTGVLDRSTRIALQRELRARNPMSSAARTVLLVRSDGESERKAQRGTQVGGTDLQVMYMLAGFKVILMEEPDAQRLGELLASQPVEILHIAAPIGQSRSSGELSLQLGEALRNRSYSVFTPSVLASVFKRSPQQGVPPIVIVDTPRPPGTDDALFQLLYRNAFAGQLFSLGELPVVLATGLTNSFRQPEQSRALVEALKDRSSPEQLAMRARALTKRPIGTTSDISLDEVLGSTCVALFARDPELLPMDYSTEFFA